MLSADEAAIERLRDYGTKPQRAVCSALFDKAMRYIALRCGRRAGKTVLFFLSLAISSLRYKGSINPYCCLRKEQAERNLAPIAKDVIRACELDAKWLTSKKEIQFANGSSIPCIGIADEGAADFLRGGKFPACGVDEAGSYRREILRNALDNVFWPALQDYEDGRFLVGGSPGFVKKGIFYEISNGDGKSEYKLFHWSAKDNTANPVIWKNFCDYRKRKGILVKSSWWQREILGNWATETELLIYPYQEKRDTVAIPRQLPRALELVEDVSLGVAINGGSLGIVAAGTEPSSGRFVSIWDHYEPRATHTLMAKLIKKADELYNPTGVFVTTTDVGDATIDRMNLNYDLGMMAADISDEQSYMRLLATDFDDGLIAVRKDSTLQAQVAEYVWENPDREKVHPDCETECCEAFMAAWSESRHRLPVEVDEGPSGDPHPHSPEYEGWIRDRMRKAAAGDGDDIWSDFGEELEPDGGGDSWM